MLNPWEVLKKELIAKVEPSSIIEIGEGNLFLDYDGLVQFLAASGIHCSKKTIYNKINKNPAEWPDSIMILRDRVFPVNGVCKWLLDRKVGGK